MDLHRLRELRDILSATTRDLGGRRLKDPRPGLQELAAVAQEAVREIADALGEVDRRLATLERNAGRRNLGDQSGSEPLD